jgi:hypothetical protein
MSGKKNSYRKKRRAELNGSKSNRKIIHCSKCYLVCMGHDWMHQNNTYLVNNPTLAQLATLTPIAKTPSWRITSSVTPSQTPTPIPIAKTKTPFSSDTSSPVPTQIMSHPLDKSTSVQTLSSLMLSRNDYQVLDDIQLNNIAPFLLGAFFKEGAATITDASTELNSICLLECTKQVWATPSENVTVWDEKVTINRKIVIAMFRSKDVIGAQKTALNLYNEFLPFEYEYGDQDKKVYAPLENTRIGIDCVNNRLAVILTTSVGSITVWVMNYPDQLADDGDSEKDIATYFANLQIMKLKNVGMVP